MFDGNYQSGAIKTCNNTREPGGRNQAKGLHEKLPDSCGTSSSSPSGPGADPLRALISDDNIKSILLSSLSTLVFYSLINKQLNGN